MPGKQMVNFSSIVDLVLRCTQSVRRLITWCLSVTTVAAMVQMRTFKTPRALLHLAWRLWVGDISDHYKKKLVIFQII